MCMRPLAGQADGLAGGGGALLARGKAGKEQVTCGVCGFVMDGAGECPRCKLVVEETAKDIKVRQEMREALSREVDKILEEGRKDPW